MRHLTDDSPTTQHILTLNFGDDQRIFNLDQPQYSIGRNLDSTIIIDAPGISRQHATIVKTGESDESFSYLIVDGDLEGNRSRNGIQVNRQSVSKHVLSHGDIIYFSQNIQACYYIINEDNKEFFESLSPSLFFKYTISAKKKAVESTQIVDRESLPNLTNLASVVELSPIPIVEINTRGTVTYLNSAANLKFPDLIQAKLKHPLLKGLIEGSNSGNGSLLIREVNFRQETFEQHIHYLAKEELIRSYIFDITKRKKAEESLKHQAFHDLLTGLPNRNFLNQKLTSLLKIAERYNKSLAVLFFDLDGFKRINDTLGHAVGDRVLECFAQRLTSQIRENDIVCRWGGDEFTVILSDIQHPDEAAQFAQRLLTSITNPLSIGEHQLYLKSSIGISLYPQDADRSEDLIKHADVALYRAKELGRNHYQFYSPRMSSEIAEHFGLENKLHQAIDNQELILHYQPQINIKTGKLYGMEALIRWQNAELGLVSPNKFIPCAEKNGLILPIGEWVLHTACQQNKTWQDMGFPPVRVAVNLSAQQFQQPNFIDLVKTVLDSTGLDPQWLELEVTESTLMHNAHLACHTLNQLRDMGVYISMDDFGTGYSSLSYLKQFPFHTLKIDQSFVRELSENTQDLAIIAAVMTLSRGLNLRVVAEGVETQEQLELLKKLDCEEMQGYFFSRPLNPEQVLNYLVSFHQKQVVSCS